MMTRSMVTVDSKIRVRGVVKHITLGDVCGQATRRLAMVSRDEGFANLG